jgi:hypothetical protein
MARNGPSAGIGGSDIWAEKPALCGFPTADQERKKNVSTEEAGGAKLTRRKHSFRGFSMGAATRDAVAGKPTGSARLGLAGQVMGAVSPVRSWP